MNEYTLPALLLPITILLLVADAILVNKRIPYRAGRLVQAVINFRNARKRDARPVQVVNQLKGETQPVASPAAIDWSAYDEPACRRNPGKAIEQTLMLNFYYD